MATSKKDLAQKIAIMQVANANGSATVYSKSSSSEVWTKNDNPMFNWGISDYKIVTDYSTLLSNPDYTTLNFTDIVNTLSYVERGKNLGDEVKYATDNISAAKAAVTSSITKNLNIDYTLLDKASLSNTELFNLISLESGGDNDTINSYIQEIQNVAKTAFRDTLVNAANKIINDTTEAYLATLPKTDAELYTNNAPTVDHLREIVKELANKASELYPDTDDGSIIELEKEGITLRFWKNLGRENVLSVSYDIAKATIGASPEYGIKTDPYGNVTYSEIEVTKSELNDAIANAITAAEYRDDITKRQVLESVSKSEAKLHEDVLNEINLKIAEAKPSFLNEAAEAAEKLDEAFHLEINGSLRKMVLDMMYPVGSLYWSSNITDPHNLFGGTWKRIKDTFIFAAGDTDTVDSTGGSKTQSLKEANLPAHSHTVTITSTDSKSGQNSLYPFLYQADSDNSVKPITNAKITVTGGGNTKTSGDSFNIMPPYTVKYCWERTN